jgi:hypothetical protein
MAAIVVIVKHLLPDVSAVQEVITCFIRPLLPARDAWYRVAPVRFSGWYEYARGYFRKSHKLSMACVQCNFSFRYPISNITASFTPRLA